MADFFSILVTTTPPTSAVFATCVPPQGCRSTPSISSTRTVPRPRGVDARTHALPGLQLREQRLLAGCRQMQDFAHDLAFARVGDRQACAILQQQLAAVAGLAPALRIEHRAVELHAAFIDGGDRGLAVDERRIHAEQFFGHGVNLTRPRGASSSMASGMAVSSE